MKLNYALQGKTVVLTGAAGGIGQGLARAFAGQGVRLVLLDRVSAPLFALADILRTVTEVHTAVCDLTSDSEVNSMVAQWQMQGWQIDVLLNNAGVEYPTPITSEDADAMARWAALMDTNVVSMVRLTRALLPLMPSGASIINQSSIWGKTGVADFSAYVASKHAVIGVTRALAFELAGLGIRVNAVCPGWIRTEAAMRSLASMAQQRTCSETQIEQELLSQQAVHTMLTPDDIAGVYLFLACADAVPLTGQSIVVSHGEVMN